MDRAFALLVVATAGAFVYLLVGLEPDGRGHGTHEQLGMMRCAWPEMHQIPCPTCGVTTAATHLVHLQPIQAIVVQPFGAVLAGSGLWLGAYCLLCLVLGASVFDRLVRVHYARLLLIGIGLLLGSWLYCYLTFQP